MQMHKLKSRRSSVALLTLISCLMMQAPLWAADENSQDETLNAIDDLFRNARLDLKAPSIVYGMVANGELVHSLSVIIDVTDRKRAEKSLKQSEEKFRALVESINDWIWEVDENGIYTYSQPIAEYPRFGVCPSQRFCHETAAF